MSTTGGGADSRTQAIALWSAIALVLVVVAGVNGAVRIGHAISGTGVQLDPNPFSIVFGLLSGQVPWPPSGTAIAIAEAALVVLLGVVVAMLVRSGGRRRGGDRRADRAAQHMGRGQDIAGLSRRAAVASATRFGMDPAVAPGVPIAIPIPGRELLYASWEDTHLDIWGPRTGKTTSRAIPAIMAAPGAVVVTSNKRDVVDATRGPRAQTGRVWVYDPQDLIGEAASWWWDPLSYVTDDVKARAMARRFAFASRAADARSDAYFDTAATNQLSALLLAAALDGRPITAVYLWLTQPQSREPARILDEHGYELMAADARAAAALTEKQRDGVFGSALAMVACLTVRAAAPWFTPTGPGDTRERFDPVTFASSGDTLYLVSREGEGTLGPLVLALTVAVAEAAEKAASTQPMGRLGRPMLLVLDEAANVCRWPDLPDLYSHYGSRGIVPMTILQSWAQGTQVWGEAGMKKLWSAANVRVYGGGASEIAFLEDLSRLIGDYDRQTVSTSTSSSKDGTSRSRSTQSQRQRIMEAADLAGLPKGRAVVAASGQRPTLVRTVPWFRGPHRAVIEASITAHDPAATATLTQTRDEVTRVEADLTHTTGEQTP